MIDAMIELREWDLESLQVLLTVDHSKSNVSSSFQDPGVNPLWRLSVSDTVFESETSKMNNKYTI